jgi:hypothetical protein
VPLDEQATSASNSGFGPDVGGRTVLANSVARALRCLGAARSTADGHRPTARNALRAPVASSRASSPAGHGLVTHEVKRTVANLSEPSRYKRTHAPNAALLRDRRRAKTSLKRFDSHLPHQEIGIFQRFLLYCTRTAHAPHFLALRSVGFFYPLRARSKDATASRLSLLKLSGPRTKKGETLTPSKACSCGPFGGTGKTANDSVRNELCVFIRIIRKLNVQFNATMVPSGPNLAPKVIVKNINRNA